MTCGICFSGIDSRQYTLRRDGFGQVLELLERARAWTQDGCSHGEHVGCRLERQTANRRRGWSFVDQVEAAFGGIDVLVNNAGYGLIALAEETGADKYRPLFEVNFFGLAEMTRAVLPVMRRQRSGHIINLSSAAGFGGSIGFAFYCATKHAVEGYSETLAMEVEHLGIRVTIVEPGGHRSDFAGASLVQGLGGSEDYATVKRQVEQYAERRHGKQPSDPGKFGLALCRLVDAAEPPLRLPLGEDAIARMAGKLTLVAQELERWDELSRSTRVDDCRSRR